MTSLRMDVDCQAKNDSFNPISFEFSRFPLDDSMSVLFTGYFDGLNVKVKSLEEMTMLYHMGCFGKSSIRRSGPKIAHSNKIPEMIRKRQFQIRNYWYRKFRTRRENIDSDEIIKEIDELTKSILSDTQNQFSKHVIDLVSSDEEDIEMEQNSFENVSHGCDDIVVILPNSDSEDDDYFANLKPKSSLCRAKVTESLVLTPQEAFFLKYGLGCLQIISGDKNLSVNECWELFKTVDDNFVHKYVVYHYFRSKGYIVKSGLKYAGNYLLYKEAPGIAHSDYIVIVKGEKDSCYSNWCSFLGHVRMAQSTVKDIIIAEVIAASGIHNLPQDLNKFSVREILVTRKDPLLNEETE